MKISVSWASEVSQRKDNNYMLEFHTCNVYMVKWVNCTFKRKKEKGEKKERTNQEILYSKGGTLIEVQGVDFQTEFVLKPIVL